MLDVGMTPRLVFSMRQALDSTWEGWALPDGWRAPRDNPAVERVW